MHKIAKCQCCGDITRVINYNGNDSCQKCLSMDYRGIHRKEIIEEIKGNPKNRTKRGKRR